MNLDKLISRFRPRSSEHMFSPWEQFAAEAEQIVLERNEAGDILAPNGLPSELQDELLAKIVRTPSFKQQFGDWENDADSASKAVYESTGEPRIVFHSTTSAIPVREGITPTEMKGESFNLATGKKTKTRSIEPAWFSSSVDDSYGYGSRRAKRDSASASAAMYPSFLVIKHPGKWGEPVPHQDGLIQYNGTVEEGSLHYAVYDKNQIIHIPFNLPQNAPKSSQG